MSKYTIVQFPDNTYGVEKRTFFGKSYLSYRNWDHWWSDDESIYRSSRFEFLIDAKTALEFVKRNFTTFGS